jgi:NitT/TauT family transport system substrate-binding protein
MKLHVLTAVLALVVPVAGSAQTAPLATVRVGTTSNDTAAIIFIAQDRGFFERAGLKVDVQPNSSTNGSSAATNVLSNSVDVAVSNVVSIAVAHAKHFPLQFIAPAGIYVSTTPIAALVVAKSSTIKTAADLDAKTTIAVDGLRNNTHIATLGWIDANGGDSHRAKFVELPFSEMAAALQRHTIDAAFISEPALTLAKEAGDVRIVGNPYDSIGRRFLINGYFSSTDWISKHPQEVARFAAAMTEAARWANNNRALSAPILVAHTKILPALVAKMTRATYGDVLTPAMIQPNINAATKYGLLTESFPARDIMYEPAAAPGPQ